MHGPDYLTWLRGMRNGTTTESNEQKGIPQKEKDCTCSFVSDAIHIREALNQDQNKIH
jgi:hypothetical protein